MPRGIAMLALGTIALAPAFAVADGTFACKDADGNWVLGNVEQRRCVGKVTRFTQADPGTARTRRAAPGPASWDEARALVSAPPEYRLHIRDAAAKYALSEELLHAVMLVESGFRPAAVSQKGAIGLMQLMPGTAKIYRADPKDPAQNLDAGARHLAELLMKYNGGVWRALAAYNAGQGAVSKYGTVPPYRETREYIRRIMENWKKQPAP